jgi:integrase
MLRTKSGLPKHCCWNTDRDGGKRRVRFRKGGFGTYLDGVPWSEDFMRQYASALEGVKAQRAELGASRTKPGSFSALCVVYYRSPQFLGLKPSTQRLRRNLIERFREQHGDKPINGLGPRHVMEIIGAKASTPEAANNLLKALRHVLDVAVAMELIKTNPAAGLKRFRSRGEGFHPWTEREIEQFLARHPLDTKAGLACALLLYTAQRGRSDVTCMGWQHVSEAVSNGKRRNVIAVRQEKTDEPLLIPLHPELLKALSAVSRSNLTFLMTERGAPFTGAGFGNWFRDRCNEAGLPHCSAHGLRKAATRRIIEAGGSNEHAKAMTGIRSDKTLAIYKRGADQQLLAGQALDLRLRAESEQNLSSKQTLLDKTGSK